jgi:methylmalonyl-CoA mutase cobalamin-binding subunit
MMGVMTGTDQLARAREVAAEAAARLAGLERNVTSDTWAAEYEAAATAARLTARRVQALETARAAELEEAGQRAAAAEAARPEIEQMAARLASSRDEIAAAAAEHLRVLAALADRAGEHNTLLAAFRYRLAELGLAGNLDNDLLAGGVTWTPVPADGLAVHALLQVFPPSGPQHPLSRVSAHSWLPEQVEQRPDGLQMPTLQDAGLQAPEPPAIAWPRQADVPQLEADRLRELEASR